MNNITYLHLIKGEKDNCIIKTEPIRMVYDFIRITTEQQDQSDSSMI